MLLFILLVSTVTAIIENRQAQADLVKRQPPIEESLAQLAESSFAQFIVAAQSVSLGLERPLGTALDITPSQPSSTSPSRTCTMT